ncbi:MMPL family transporter [Janibacter anophelis]|uniref:MMPL family transporter n=1 Tax=Janibacter anophelis TaxID=319054 RepID=UPI003F7DDC1A
MALRLHHLGRWCATHARRVLVGWLVVLVAVGAAALAFGRPLTNEVTVPGSDFERVLADLQTEIPDAAGGFGTVVLHSEGGEFTPAQRRVIDKVFAEWKREPQVKTVIDPFENQKTLDDSRRELVKSKKDIASGQKELDKAWRKISLGQGQVDYGEAWIDYFEKNDPDNPMLAKIRTQVTEGKKDLRTGKADYAKGERKLASGRTQYAAGTHVADGAADTRFVTDDGYALTQIQFETNTNSVDPEVKEAIVEIGQQLADAGIDAQYSVEITQENTLVGPGEAVGLVIAAIVLMIALGSLVAAGLPIAGALLGVGVGLAGAVAATHVFDMHSMTPALALMLGLAVGIDYALFIVNRHRTQILDGRDVTDSIAHAVGTAGSAVVVAGTTVAIALIALVVTPVPLLGQMGLVAAGTVAAAVLVALTLTPALLGLVGSRVVSRRAWGAHGYATPGTAREDAADADPDDVFGAGYVRAVTRRPALVVLAVVALCGLLAVPALSLRLGLPDGSSEPVESTAHQAHAQVDEHFGAGANGPVIAVATLDEPAADEDDVLVRQSQVVSRLRAVGGVHAVIPFGVSEDRRTLAFQVVTDKGPADAATSETVRLLTASAGPIGEATHSEIGLTGQTVANIEISQRLAEAMPPYLAVVIGLSLVLLTVVFRSILVPLVATGGFLLSVGASFGAAVAVYQWGWLGPLLAVDTPGPMLSFMPIMLIGVLFGLAMDYQMFLVSGMKEAHAHGADARTAVRRGFTHGSKVVLAAALIMAAVFAGFVFAHLTMIRPIGFALAVGVLVDALLVRMTLTPAVMHLLGEVAWWMPRCLDRLLPDLDVEGTALQHGGTKGETATTAQPATAS